MIVDPYSQAVVDQSEPYPLIEWGGAWVFPRNQQNFRQIDREKEEALPEDPGFFPAESIP